MPLPWLIGAAAVAAVAAIAKAVTDDSPSPSTTTRTHDDSDRLRQEKEAAVQRERDGLKKNIAKQQQDRREQLKTQLRLSAAALASAPGQASSVDAFAKMSRLTLEGISGERLEKIVDSTVSSLSGYGTTLKPLLASAQSIKVKQISAFLQGVNMLETVTTAANASAADKAALAQVQAANARIGRLQQLKAQLLPQV